MTAAVASPPISLPMRIAPLARSNEHAVNFTDERAVNFVRSSWSKSAVPFGPMKVWTDKEGKPEKFQRMDEGSYFSALTRGKDSLINRILAGSECFAAVPNDTPTLLAGWMVYDTTTLHYLYVPKTFRKMGVARALIARLPKTVVDHSFWTPAFEKIRPQGQVWNPTRLWMLKGCNDQ